MTGMRVLVVGSGAREHAIAWKLASGPHKPDILAAPGNAGTASVGTNHDVDAEDIDGLVRLALEESVDMTIVGPEAPLDAGIVDRFEERGLKAFGPSQAAARIESSKSFAKRVMADCGVPTARADVFSNHGDAVIHVRKAEPPYVIKADGLAAGKGVIMAPTAQDAERALDSLFVERTVGTAGDTVLIEEWLQGTELSVFRVCGRGVRVGNDRRLRLQARTRRRPWSEHGGDGQLQSSRVLEPGARGSGESYNHGAGGRADGQNGLSV